MTKEKTTKDTVQLNVRVTPGAKAVFDNIADSFDTQSQAMEMVLLIAGTEWFSKHREATTGKKRS